MATETILGISPGTRIMGFAVIKDGELVEWRVKTFKEKWSKEKQGAILSIITRLIDHFDVKRIALKKIDPLSNTHQLEILIRAIEMLAQKKRISIKRYSLSDLDIDKRSGKRDGRAKLTERIAERHPELKQEYLKERNNRKEYYTKMFEAIAMAERCRET